jgi:ABC-2 type transport system ATP-binding protein
MKLVGVPETKPNQATERPSPLIVANLTKSFGASKAVDDVTLSVGRGEVRALIGTNGSGKTTTIRCIGGLLHPDRGLVTVLGADTVRSTRLVRRHIGIVSQHLAVYRGLLVRDNLKFFAQLMGGPGPVSLDEIGERLDLTPLLAKPVVQLSLGQQRLVHIASVLVHDPSVIVLDEPTASLDQDARHKLFALLHECAERGAAVLMATHRLEEVEEHCSTVTIMQEGKMIASGAVAQVIATRCGPRSRSPGNRRSSSATAGRLRTTDNSAARSNLSVALARLAAASASDGA